MYEVIFLKELYSDPGLSIHAGYINQDKKLTLKSHPASLPDAQEVILFFEAKTPNTLFTLRTYGRYRHVLNNLFCVTSSPVGPIFTQNEKLSETALHKVNQWVKQELRMLGL
ncbi:hypothetical protein [Effusibacillus pohliae]|uniref:hypothetical protein n=1 Tax=Effusibacillus pohliae TaxID=232270 RepID=UPI0003724025|nr:hypothetical protein [Effusibacillus pohliae]